MNESARECERCGQLLDYFEGNDQRESAWERHQSECPARTAALPQVPTRPTRHVQPVSFATPAADDVDHSPQYVCNLAQYVPPASAAEPRVHQHHPGCKHMPLAPGVAPLPEKADVDQILTSMTAEERYLHEAAQARDRELSEL
jgi:hypothetical protein